MSQNQFSSLMNQYGDQAEQKKITEHRAERRGATFAKARRVCLLLFLLAAFAAAIVYRHEVQTVIARVTTKSSTSTPYTVAEQNTKLKVAGISKEADQRKEAIEATFK